MLSIIIDGFLYQIILTYLTRRASIDYQMHKKIAKTYKYH